MRAVESTGGRGVAPPPRTAAPRHGHRAFGAVLVAIGGLPLMAEAGVDDDGWPAAPALLLFVVGCSVVAQAARCAAYSGLIALGIALTLITSLSAAFSSLAFPLAGACDHSFAPTAIEQLPDTYELWVGTMIVDLTYLELA